MCGSLLLHMLLLLQFTDVLLVDSKMRTNPGGNHVEAQAVGMPDWGAFSTPKGPHFAADSPRHVTAAVGTPAHIPCKARNLGSKSVSWIRHRDLHVLTVSSFTFTNDERFSAHRDPATGDWVLVLRRPMPSDSGFYECSISTKPVTAISVKLDVVVPTAELLGDGEVYLDRGSTLNLTCVVHFSPTPPEFILWYHRETLVNYGSRDGREIKVDTVHRGDTTHSSLLVHNATIWDSGRYSCKPSNAQKVSIGVHVLKSETPAAMQTTTSSAPPAAATQLLSTVFVTAFCTLAAATHLFSPVFVTAFCIIAALAHAPDANSLICFISSCLSFPFFTLFTNR
ncbi:protein sidekick-2-like [Panulirus ornatus]|uniref:protein sidekick-2-like n=1 Tax=Panulirus ornatus TaxID=150431 RepID=UPI003A895C36